MNLFLGLSALTQWENFSFSSAFNHVLFLYNFHVVYLQFVSFKLIFFLSCLLFFSRLGKKLVRKKKKVKDSEKKEERNFVWSSLMQQTWLFRGGIFFFFFPLWNKQVQALYSLNLEKLVQQFKFWDFFFPLLFSPILKSYLNDHSTYFQFLYKFITFFIYVSILFNNYML